jgi:hypothetical protein
MLLELCVQSAVRLGRARQDDHTAGFLIQAVNDPNPAVDWLQ